MKWRPAAAVVAIVLGVVGCSPADEVEKEPAPASQSRPHPKIPKYNNPSPGDFKVGFKVRSKKCYDYGIGCLVEVEPELKYTGAKPLDPDESYDVTFEVSGDEAGKVIETLTVTGDDYRPWPVYLSTKSRGVKPEAKVTGVEEATWSAL